MKHAAISIVEGAEGLPQQTPSSARVPHLTVAVFCVTAATRGAIERGSKDRRLTRVKTEVSDGGIAKACKVFATRRTPSLLIVEVSTTGQTLLDELDALAEVCDPETTVVLIGADNDIALYRVLMARGIAEYLAGTIEPLTYVATIQRLFAQDADPKLGKVYAFVGVKGGVGASTLAQNLAWTLAEEQASPTLLLDLDFRFGSAAMNLDLKPVTGIEKYVGEPEKLDEALLDRLIVQRGEYLSILPGFNDPLGEVDPAPNATERLIEIARASFPFVVLDLPHDWSAASRDALTSADEVIVVASPDLPNLRNARALIAQLRSLRPNDAPPRVILNACRVPRRKEIAPDKFAKSIGIEAFTTILFDAATFGKAAADGRTLREQAPRSKVQATLKHLALDLMAPGKEKPRGRFRRLFGL